MLQKKLSNDNIALLNSFNKKLKNTKNTKWSANLDDELHGLLAKIQSCNISHANESDLDYSMTVLNNKFNKLTLAPKNTKSDFVNKNPIETDPKNIKQSSINYILLGDESELDIDNVCKEVTLYSDHKDMEYNCDIESDFISQYPIDPTEFKRILEFKVDLRASLELINKILGEFMMIFDLDGTFLYVKSRNDRSGNSCTKPINPKYLNKHFRKRNYYVYPRPGAFEFLQFLLHEYKNVAIWTSMEERNAQPIIEHMVGEENMSLFKFIWYRSECQKNVKNGKWATEKPINKIINDKRINPQRLLKHTDVIIFEDNPQKVQLNDTNCVRIIPTFDATKVDNDDNFLFTLMDDIKKGNFNVNYMSKKVL